MTLATSEPRLRRLIDAVALYRDLPGFRGLSGAEILEGLVLTESSGVPTARRYEPHQDRAGRKDQRTDGDRPGVDDGANEDDSSYGLTQVMGYNLRALVGVAPGVEMSFTFAYYPEVALWAGAKILRSEIAAVQRELKLQQPDDECVARGLARYNGGPTGDDPDPARGGDYRLRRYVEKVHNNALLAHRDRVAHGWRIAG